jgi:hypothetical protein
MSTDSQNLDESAPRVDPRSLPAVNGLLATRVQYESPRITYIDRERKKFSEAVEIDVEVDRACTMSAVSPALYIGEYVVTDYERISGTKLRYFLYEFADVAEGTPIAIGWADSPRGRKETGFEFVLEKRGDR